MEKLHYRISLDMFETVSQKVIKAKKGDTACDIIITLTENGKVYQIADGCYATFSAKKPDGNILFNSETCKIDNNNIIYEFTDQTTTCEGVVECEVILYDAVGNRLTSPRFSLLVGSTVYNPIAIMSSSEADALNSLIIEVDKKVAEASAIIGGVNSALYKEKIVSRNLIDTRKYENIEFSKAFYKGENQNFIKAYFPISDSSMLEDGARYMVVMIIDGASPIINDASWTIMKANGEALCGRAINNPVKAEEIPKSYKDACWVELYFNETMISNSANKTIQGIQLVKYTGTSADTEYSRFEKGFVDEFAIIAESTHLKKGVTSLNKIDCSAIKGVRLENWKQNDSNIRRICDIIPNSFDVSKKYRFYVQATNGTDINSLSNKSAIIFTNNGTKVFERGSTALFSGAEVVGADEVCLYINDAAQKELTDYYIDFVQVVEGEIAVTNEIPFAMGRESKSEIDKSIENLETLVEDIVSPVPSKQYTEDYIESFYDRVWQDTKPTDSLFGFITDIQSDGSDYMLNHYKNIGKVAEKLPVAHIIDGGDFIMGNDEKSKTVELLKNYSRLVHKNSIPYLITKGNHDDNGFYATNNGKLYDDLITDTEWYELVTKYNERYPNVVVDKNNPTGGYCYIDDEASKIRTIVVNVCDIPYIKNADGTATYNAMQNYAIRQQQLDFIYNALKCSDKGTSCSEWGIILTAHFAEYVTVNWSCVIDMLLAKCGAIAGDNTYTKTYDDTDPNKVFGAEITYNFDDYRGDVICVLAGHTHKDNTPGESGTGNTIAGHITQIITESSLPLSNEKEEDGTIIDDRTIGTVNEECFDIVKVDRANKKIKCHRFGKGSDREFTYNAHTAKTN